MAREQITNRTNGVGHRLQRSTIALASRDGCKVAITIPAGAKFEVVGPSEDPRFWVVAVDGEQLMVFQTDLMARSSFRPQA